MALVKPFYHHVHGATGLMARAPEEIRYPYHDNDQCPVGQRVKASDDWQYYRDEPETRRPRCPVCADPPAHPPQQIDRYNPSGQSV